MCIRDRLRIVPADPAARAARATAARALGQRTDSANARGFYITEALQIEGKLLMQGQPVNLDVIRTLLNTPRADQLASASLDRKFQFVRYLVDARKAKGQRMVFTIAAQGEPEIRQVQLRNAVLVITPVYSRGERHVEVTQSALADFVLGKGVPTNGGEALAELDRMLDRSRMLPPAAAGPAVTDAKGEQKYNSGLEH